MIITIKIMRNIGKIYFNLLIREHIFKHTKTTFKRPSGVATISL